MFRHAFIPSRRIPLLFAILLGLALPAAVLADARVSETYGKLPLHFEANQGQTHENVRFLARGPGYSLYLTAGEAVVVLAKPSPDEKGKRSAQASPGAPAQPEAVSLRMGLVGAERKPIVTGLEELPGKANYFVGSDPAKWRTNVPTYSKVHYSEVYPGIDLVYYGNQRQLEYDFIVAPGADPKKIVLGFKGADRLEIDAQGELVLHMAGGAIRQKKPVIYQEIDGVRQVVAGGYVRKGAKRVGFKVAAYDTSQPLIIDPVLAYSTYLGGSGGDSGNGIALDAGGNAYVTGNTMSTDFPTTSGAFQLTFGGGGIFFGGDAFVTKLDSTGSALVYSTYIGGSAPDSTSDIVVDADGNAYVTGSTSSTDFPTTVGAFQTISGGSSEAFVTKLNPTGSALVYSTYLGGSSGDAGRGIALDAAGNAYVTGGTESLNFPTTAGAFQPARAGGFPGDAFVTKLDATGSSLVYSTFLGGSDRDGGNGIAVDADGNAYVAGSTLSTNFPTTPGAVQPICGGGACGGAADAWDAFVTKLDPTGSTLVYSTFLGGSRSDTASGIAVDTQGNAYVTGRTDSNNFPTTVGAFQTTFVERNAGGSRFVDDAFVTKLHASGLALVYSTYLGGGDWDESNGIAVDAAGNAYVTGRTSSTDFPTTAGAFQTSLGGSWDAFVTKLNPTGSALVYSTYLGGAQQESGAGIAVDTGNNAYVTGQTSSSNFPTTTGAFQTTFSGGGEFYVSDAFVAKISDATTRSEESASTYTGSWTSYGAESGTFSGGSILASNNVGATATFSFTGTAVTWIGVRCDICGIATVSIDGGPPAMVNTAGPSRPPNSLVSEPVYSASGLAPGVTHTMVITVTGTTTTSVPGLVAGHAQIAVDAFDVTP